MEKSNPSSSKCFDNYSGAEELPEGFGQAKYEVVKALLNYYSNIGIANKTSGIYDYLEMKSSGFVKMGYNKEENRMLYRNWHKQQSTPSSDPSELKDEYVDRKVDSIVALQEVEKDAFVVTVLEAYSRLLKAASDHRDDIEDELKQCLESIKIK